MTNWVLAAIALGLVASKVFAQQQDPLCRQDEYPREVEVGEYGEVKFKCAKMECGNLNPKCNQVFYELSCKDKQWVGGLAGSSNLNNLVPLQCCDVPALAAGRSAGTKVLAAGSRFVGDQQRDRTGNMVSYDVITNLQKADSGNRKGLEVHVARMVCKGKGPTLQGAQLSDFGSVDTFGTGLGSADLGANSFVDNSFDSAGFGHEAALPLDNFGSADLVGADLGAPIADFGGQAFGPPIGPAGPPLAAPAPLAAPIAPALAPIPLGGGAACFTSDTTVETPTGTKTMDELKVGDHVLTIDDGIQKFTPVKSFIHRLPEKFVKFQHIQAEDGTSLKLTAQHFLYTASCDNPAQPPVMRFAEEVQPGDCWVKVDSELQTQRRVRIVSNSIVHQTGAYAPLTSNGIIVTEGVMASCHSVFKNDEFMDAFVHYADMVKNMFGGLFSFAADKPEGTVELPWLIKYGQTHLSNLILGESK